MASPFYTRLEELVKAAAFDPANTTASEVLANIGSPTTSIAILDNGEISSHCISTKSDNTETLFQACSISKPIGGLMITKLIELGHFGVNDKMVDLLPGEVFELMATDPRKEALLRTVTVKQLMSHTAGLSVHGFPGYFPDPNKVPTLYEILKGGSASNTHPVTMKALPGLEFMYSGGGMSVLQCIAEHIMKKSFPELMKQYVFDPLGMSRSCYHLNKDEQNVPFCHWNGYYPTPVKWHIQPELMAAGLWTTPTDLLKVVRAIQDSLSSTRPDTCLKKETAQLMLTAIKEEFGLTWMANEYSFGHGGNNYPGWECFLIGFADLPWNEQKRAEDQPERQKHAVIPQGCGISIMTNSAMGSQAYKMLISTIAYLKGWSVPSGKLFGNTYTLMPFPAMKDANGDKSWEEWIGDSWTDGWIIAKDKDGHPVAGIDKAVLVKLRPAAIPSKQYPSGKESIDFVLDGISIMLRLSWEKDDRIIEVCNWGKEEVKTVRRKGSTT